MYCDQERKEVIANYFPLVRKIAIKIASKVPSDIVADDLVGYGSLGLIDAVDRYDSRLGVHLKNYAAYRIRGAILDGLREVDHYSRSMRQKIKDIEKAKFAVESRIHRLAEDWEIAKEMGIDIKRYFKVCSDIYNAKLLNLDDFIGDEHDNITQNTFESLIKSVDDPVQNVIIKETKSYLIVAIKHLPEKQRKVIFSYYYDNLTFKEIGETLNLTESRISQIHSKAITTLRLLLKKEVNKMESERNFYNEKEVGILGINSKIIARLKEQGIFSINDLQGVKSGDFAKKLHHHTVRAIARRMVEKNIFFSDGEVATKKLIDITSPFSKEVSVSSNGNALAQLTASSMAGAISEFIRAGTVVEEIESTITFSVNNQRYKFNISLIPTSQ